MNPRQSGDANTVEEPGMDRKGVSASQTSLLQLTSQPFESALQIKDCKPEFYPFRNSSITAYWPSSFLVAFLLVLSPSEVTHLCAISHSRSIVEMGHWNVSHRGLPS